MIKSCDDHVARQPARFNLHDLNVMTSTLEEVGRR